MKKTELLIYLAEVPFVYYNTSVLCFSNNL